MIYKKYILFLFILPFFNCSTKILKTDLSSMNANNKKIKLIFNNNFDKTTSNIIRIKFIKQIPKKFHLVNKNEDISIHCTAGKINYSYIPMYSIIPVLLSYVGCPLGSMTQLFNFRIVDNQEKKIISIWQFKIKKVFSLYYLSPVIKKRINEDIIKLSTKHLISFFN